MNKYQCPKCKSDELEVTIQAWATLIQTEDGNIETDTSTPDDGSHEWDDNSSMKCTDCGHFGKVGEFICEDDKPFRCDQCEALMINGAFCHETGCPNTKKTWMADRGEWVLFLECRECGDEIEKGQECSCFSRYDEVDATEDEDEA